MIKTPLRVVIIGAGTGGLCLAQGLKPNNIAVEVFERDHSPSDSAAWISVEDQSSGQSSAQIVRTGSALSSTTAFQMFSRAKLDHIIVEKGRTVRSLRSIRRSRTTTAVRWVGSRGRRRSYSSVIIGPR